MAASDNSSITDAEFAQFQRLIYQIAGISLADSKKVLLVGRLGKRLKALNLATFGAYYKYISVAVCIMYRMRYLDRSFLGGFGAGIQFVGDLGYV